MLIQYKANGMQREVRDPVARALIRRRLASEVQPAACESPQVTVSLESKVDDDAPYGRKADGSPRARPGRKAPQPETGKYNRRDMQAED